MQIVIIEDEHLAQLELKRLLDQCHQEIDVLAYLDSIAESVPWLRTHAAPDLIFMDIQLADGLSFEIFKQVEVITPVIFTTAYDEYALQAFKVNSVDYLLKPVELKDLQASLKKHADLKQFYTESPLAFTPTQIEQLLNFRKPQYKTRFVSKIGDHLKHIAIAEVAYFYADDKTVFLVTRDQKELIVDYTLSDLTALLNPTQFYRLNRTYLAHVTAIAQVTKHFDGRLKVTLMPPAKEAILISRPKTAEFKQWLDS
jgi:two-component system, LytTR family, response regulator LytT